MQPVWIAIAIIFAVGFTIVLAVGIAFAWYLILQMRKLHEVTSQQAKIMLEVMGDGSIVRMASAARVIAESIPEMLKVVKAFNVSMESFTKVVFSQENAVTPTRTQEPGDSAFYSYSESRAADSEVSRRRTDDTAGLTAEERKGMRTDAPIKPVPESILPPKPPEGEEQLTDTAV